MPYARSKQGHCDESVTSGRRTVACLMPPQGPDPLLGKADAASPSAHADRILPDPPFPNTRDGRHPAVQSDERPANCFEQLYLWAGQLDVRLRGTSDVSTIESTLCK